MRNEIVLKGCKPDIIMHNLKALGIFRIIAEQKDSTVLAWWTNDEFIIETELGQKELVEFLCNSYEPTPLIAPWNGGSGFDKNNDTTKRIRDSDNPRLAEYGRVVQTTYDILKEMFGYDVGSKISAETKKSMGVKKKTLIAELRNRLPEVENTQNIRFGSVLSWIDTTCVPGTDSIALGPILLTGGNDGRFDVSNNFMKNVIDHMIDVNANEEAVLIQNMLFATPAAFEKNKVGPFLPGAYSGTAANPTGDDKYTLSNPWDYMLAMEGIVLFAGSIYRRGESSFAAFPFSVKASHAGYDTACAENDRERGEIWIPMWNSPATYDEISYIFAEGRVQSTKKLTRGAEFAVALANFGAMRGISSFQRFGVLKRRGKAHHIASTGRIKSAENTDKKAFSDMRWTKVEEWLDTIRREKNLPESITTLLRMIDENVIRYCINRNPRYLQDILILIGRVEHQLALSSRLNAPPLNSLSKGWIKNCDHNVPEFRLAAALGSIHGTDFFYPIRCNLEPIDLPESNKHWNNIKWKSKNPSTTWGRGDLVRNMIAVLERRCSDGLSCGKSMPMAAHVYAKVDDVVQFIEGRVDDDMIYDLVLPLSLINYDENGDTGFDNMRILTGVPEPYICIKSNFPPVPVLQNTKMYSSDASSTFESTVIGLLKSGRQYNALELMRRRLKISGYDTVTYGNADTGSELNRTMMLRLCAAMLFPIHQKDMKELLERLQPPSDWRA